ncbi:MAG: SprT-like domain-containing protein [Ginsengibacter sp.]
MAKIESPFKLLKDYLPEGSFDKVEEYLLFYKVHFTISRARKTVLGNYKSRHSNKNHRISVNGNLNKYSFLITLLHELGHLVAFEKYGAKILSHGAEWKREYGLILHDFVTRGIFPEDIKNELLQTLKNPAASSCAEDSLLRVLRRYDPPVPGVFLVEDLPDETYFVIRGGRLFQKVEKVRKRYLCKDIGNGRMYLFSPVAEVKVVENYSHSPHNNTYSG